MKIISIDPGYERLGIAILEKEEGLKEKIIYSECFRTSKKLPHEERLLLIQKRIAELTEKYKPGVLAIEKVFFNTNQKTASKVSEVRGLIIGNLKGCGCEIFEFSPPQIKLAVTGDGSSDKTQVIKMVKLLIGNTKDIKYDDEYDAIAIGLAFFALEKSLRTHR